MARDHRIQENNASLFRGACGLRQARCKRQQLRATSEYTAHTYNKLWLFLLGKRLAAHVPYMQAVAHGVHKQPRTTTVPRKCPKSGAVA